MKGAIKLNLKLREIYLRIPWFEQLYMFASQQGKWIGFLSALEIHSSRVEQVAGYFDKSRNERFEIFPIYHSVCILFCKSVITLITLCFISKRNPSRHPRFKVGSRGVVRVWSANEVVFRGRPYSENRLKTHAVPGGLSPLTTQRKVVKSNA